MENEIVKIAVGKSILTKLEILSKIEGHSMDTTIKYAFGLYLGFALLNIKDKQDLVDKIRTVATMVMEETEL